MFKLFTVFSFVFVFSVNSSANEPSRKEESSYNWDVFLTEWSSPLTTDAKYPLFIVGGISVLLGTALRDSVVEPVQKDLEEAGKNVQTAADIGDVLGQGTMNLAYYGVQLGTWFFDRENKKAYDRSWYMLKATAYSSLTTVILKNTIRQQRPNGGARTSYPSGHTTTAFAFASVVGVEHEWYWGVLAYSTAAFVGLSRIYKQAHFLHDVFAGAAIGMSYGLGLHYLEKRREQNKKTDEEGSPELAVFPAMGNDQFTMNVFYRF